MTVHNWGNEDPSRQQQHTPLPGNQPFRYFTLYLTIVGAILTAFFIMAICSILFSAALLKAFTADLKAETRALSTPVQQHSPALQRDLQQLANKSAKQISEPLQQRAQTLSKQAQQQSAAHKTNVQTCDFWRQQYEKDKSDRNKMHVNSSCELAHGKLWNGIK